MRRALLGGSFDPPHRGHLAIVDELLRRGVADRVVVVPARISPGKPAPAAADRHRLAMLRLALAGRPEVTVWDEELRRPGPSYTVDTLRAARRRWPGDTLLLVVGADAWAGLARWREPETIRRLARLVVVPRPGWPAPGEGGALPAGVTVLDGFRVPVSSTAVREALARGAPPAGDLPPAVRDYIVRHGLYGLPAPGEGGE